MSRARSMHAVLREFPIASGANQFTSQSTSPHSDAIAGMIIMYRGEITRFRCIIMGSNIQDFSTETQSHVRRLNAAYLVRL